MKNDINKDRIILMSKMAIYDKTYGTEDKKANDLFYRDYVYRRNFVFRTAALIGTLIPIGIYTVFIITSDNMDFLSFDYMQYLINIGIIVAIVMGVYTFIGTKVATAEYKNIKIRLQQYFALMRELDELTEGKAPNDEDGYDEYDPTNMYQNQQLNDDAYKASLRSAYAKNNN